MLRIRSLILMEIKHNLFIPLEQVKIFHNNHSQLSQQNLLRQLSHFNLTMLLCQYNLHTQLSQHNLLRQLNHFNLLKPLSQYNLYSQLSYHRQLILFNLSLYSPQFRFLRNKEPKRIHSLQYWTPNQNNTCTIIKRFWLSLSLQRVVLQSSRPGRYNITRFTRFKMINRKFSTHQKELKLTGISRQILNSN